MLSGLSLECYWNSFAAESTFSDIQSSLVAKTWLLLCRTIYHVPGEEDDLRFHLEGK